MPRTMSAAMVAEMYKQETGEAILVLVTIDHAELPEPLRVTSDAVNTISNGNTFVAFPFEIVLPDEPEDGRPPRSRVRVSNVDREIVESLRSITNGIPKFDLSVVRGSDPDVIEATWPQFGLENGTYDSMYVQGELTLDDILQLRYPAHDYLPIWFPGLH